MLFVLKGDFRMQVIQAERSLLLLVAIVEPDPDGQKPERFFVAAPVYETKQA